MIGALLIDTLLLLGAAVFAVAVLQRLHVPSILAYLVVGLALGPYTAGPVVDARYIGIAAEFGIVFLLFTIGLNFSLPAIYALRQTVFALGTGQVALTTAGVALIAWAAGLPGPAAFVVGAVFAQSSTTIISRQLFEQGEEQSLHGRKALAMSVFQDVTAVPFVVAIPVLAHGTKSIALPLAMALVKGLLAFALVFFGGRRMLRPLFQLITERRSPELFTLTVLFVSLLSAWATSSLGLSMAFGAFLAGMVLGETEFRHQVESAIRPFRDVLLGLFFVTVGMLFDPRVLPEIWQWTVLAAVALVVTKVVLVGMIVRVSGGDWISAWRVALVLAVGGEFGFALIAIALNSEAIGAQAAQIALTAVLLSMFAGPFLIRYNRAIATLLARRAPTPGGMPNTALPEAVEMRNHVVLCGYGRIGQGIARFLTEEGIPYVAIDLDAARVRDAHLAGNPVYYGDASDHGVLDALGVRDARLVIVSHDDVGATLKLLEHVRAASPTLPVMVRTADETHVEELRRAGAAEVVPETAEAALMIASHALLLLSVPASRVVRRMREARENRYQLLRELFGGQDFGAAGREGAGEERLHSIRLHEGAYAIGRSPGELALEGAQVRHVVRNGVRHVDPDQRLILREGDVLVLFGTPADIERSEARVLTGKAVSR